MGVNFYRLNGNTDYTLCLELINTDRNLWNDTQINVDKDNSTGLTIGNVNVSNHTQFHQFKGTITIYVLP